MKKHVKIILIIAVVVIIAAVAAYSSLAPKQTAVVTVNAALWESTFTETGDAVSRDSADIFALYGGEVINVYVKEGDKVSAGFALMEFSPADIDVLIKQSEEELNALEGLRENTASQLDTQIDAAEAELTALQNTLSGAHAAYENAQSVLSDALLLFDLGEISERELKQAADASEDRLRAVNAAQSAVNAAASQLSSLRSQRAGLTGSASGLGKQYAAQISSLETSIAELHRKRSELTVRSPIDGTVGAFGISKGEIIQPGMPITAIHSEALCDIECFVRVKDAFFIKPGDKVTVTLQLRDGKLDFDGRVTDIGGDAVDVMSSLGLNEKRVKIKIEAEGERWTEIKPGYGLDIKFTILSIPDAVSVPKSTLFQTEYGWAVWVIEEGKAVSRTVERGDETAASVVITSGLNAGDIVVKDASLDDIKEGMRLTPAG